MPAVKEDETDLAEELLVALDAVQKEKLGALLAQEHLAVLVTRGEKWPTANLQAFAETPEFDLLFIMGASADKYQNLLKHPEATVLVDNRDVGKVPTFEIVRAWMQGSASDVTRGSAEWESLKAIFLKKNPFEEPFFKSDGLRMIRIRPARVSYASGLRDSFKAEL
jgi:Pyridoxamine 5'-phosphate oxidase